MKKILSLVLIMMMAISLFSACADNKDKDAEKNNGEKISNENESKDIDSGNNSGTYITVNGEVISMDSFNSTLEMYKNNLAAQYGIADRVKEVLILNSLIMQDLKKNNVEVGEDRIKKDYEDSINESGGLEAHKELLKSVGVTEEEDKRNKEISTYFAAHREWYNENNKPAEEEIAKYFEENKDDIITVKASHILVATEDEAKNVKKRLDAGEKFEELAKELTLDEASKAVGGLLGEKNPNEYVPEFAEALKKMKTSEISEPVKTEHGYHIIRVEDKKDTLESLKEEIALFLGENKYQEYLKSLQDSAEVVDPRAPKEEMDNKDEKMNDEKMNDEKKNDEKTEDEKTEDEKMNDEKMNDEKTNDEKMNDEKTDDKETEKE